MKAITIFGASSEVIPEIYKQAAFRLGELIAREGWVQYNGGGNNGLMGYATRGSLQHGGEVHGIIIDVYKHAQADGLRSCVVVDQFSVRKQLLMEAGNVIVALPGGVGTLSEIFHVLDEYLADLYRGKEFNPLIIFNVNGFYDGLLAWIDRHILQEHFLHKDLYDRLIHSAVTAEEVVDLIQAHG